MRPKLLLPGLLLLTFAVCGRATADEPQCCLWPWNWQALHVRCQCPDDYCPKPLPGGLCPVHYVGPDDYCSKPLPRVCPWKCFGEDDYCAKPYPTLSRCWPPNWFTCGPAKCPTGCGAHQ